MRSVAFLALVSAVAAQYKGFNYGATNNDGSIRAQADFENLFKSAQALVGASGFSSARLYTMIQGGTTNTPTSAIQAAIDTKTTLLLGLWASAGQANIDNEIAALKTAISQSGTAFTDLIAGISVGSEDLYRVSPTGIENMSGAGATPDEIVSYIGQVRSAISGTAASGAKIGHVDTWTAWVNGSNSAVNNAVDWLGVDSYPYYQTTDANSISNGANLFFESYNNTVGVAGGKEVWITETGWPYQGPTANQAVPSTQNAETYWQDVACRVVGNINTWWYTLYDPQASGALSFGLQSELNSAPLYDLSCSASSSASSSSAVSTSSSAASTSASLSAPVVVSSASSSSAAPNSSSAGSTSASVTAPVVVSGTSSASMVPVTTSPVTKMTTSNGSTIVMTVGETTISSAVSAPANVSSGGIATVTSTATATAHSSGPSSTASASNSVAPYTGSASTVATSFFGLAAAGVVALLAL